MKRLLTTLKEKWPEYLLEILVLIVGIYGAFALDRWNEKMQETRIEKSALIDLKNEFLLNQQKLERSIAAKQRGLDKSLLLLEMISTGEVELESFGHAWGLQTINPSFGVIEKLTATGKIDYLKNDSLRYLLSQWKERVLDLKENEELHLKFVIEQARPHVDQMIPVIAKSRNPILKPLQMYDKEQVNQFTKILSKDLKFQNHLTRNVGTCANALKAANEVKMILDKILLHLDEEIALKN